MTDDSIPPTTHNHSTQTFIRSLADSDPAASESEVLTNHVDRLQRAIGNGESIMVQRGIAEDLARKYFEYRDRELADLNSLFEDHIEEINGLDFWVDFIYVVGIVGHAHTAKQAKGPSKAVKSSDQEIEVAAVYLQKLMDGSSAKQILDAIDNILLMSQQNDYMIKTVGRFAPLSPDILEIIDRHFFNNVIEGTFSDAGESFADAISGDDEDSYYKASRIADEIIGFSSDDSRQINTNDPRALMLLAFILLARGTDKSEGMEFNNQLRQGQKQVERKYGALIRFANKYLMEKVTNLVYRMSRSDFDEGEFKPTQEDCIAITHLSMSCFFVLNMGTILRMIDAFEGHDVLVERLKAMRLLVVGVNRRVSDIQMPGIFDDRLEIHNRKEDIAYLSRLSRMLGTKDINDKYEASKRQFYSIRDVLMNISRKGRYTVVNSIYPGIDVDTIDIRRSVFGYSCRITCGYEIAEVDIDLNGDILVIPPELRSKKREIECIIMDIIYEDVTRRKRVNNVPQQTVINNAHRGRQPQAGVTPQKSRGGQPMRGAHKRPRIEEGHAPSPSEENSTENFSVTETNPIEFRVSDEVREKIPPSVWIAVSAKLEKFGRTGARGYPYARDLGRERMCKIVVAKDFRVIVHYSEEDGQTVGHVKGVIHRSNRSYKG